MQLRRGIRKLHWRCPRSGSGLLLCCVTCILPMLHYLYSCGCTDISQPNIYRRVPIQYEHMNLPDLLYKPSLKEKLIIITKAFFLKHQAEEEEPLANRAVYPLLRDRKCLEGAAEGARQRKR